MLFEYFFSIKIPIFVLSFVFCISIILKADDIELEVSPQDIDNYAKQLDIVIAKPANITCKITVRYGLSRSLEDASKNGPSINVRTSKARWIVRDKNELYESIHALNNDITGVIESQSKVFHLNFRGTYFTDGDYIIEYPYFMDEIPHGWAMKVKDYNPSKSTRPVTLMDYLKVFDFIHDVNNIKSHDAIKKNLGIDEVRFVVSKINNRELIIRPNFMKDGSAFTKYTYRTCYDIREGTVPVKNECFYEGKFYSGHFVIGSIKRSEGKYFPKKLITIFRYHSSETDDKESFQKMLNDERFAVVEFIVDEVDFDCIPEDKDFNITVPPDVSLFANEDSNRSISLEDGKNIVGLRDLKRLSDRAELQYQLQVQKSAKTNISVDRGSLPIYRIICFVVGVLILGLMVYLSIKANKKTKDENGD